MPFEKGKTYRVTIGYKMLDESTGTVQVYLSVDGFEVTKTYVLGKDQYMQYAPYVDSIAFTSSTAIANGIRISDPGLTEEDERHTLTLQNDGKTIVKEAAWKYTLPELNAYEYNKKDCVFVGWSVGGKLYPAGYEFELTADTTLEAVWFTMSMRDGAAVRMVGDSGLRFLVDLNSAAYSAALEAELILGTGTLIVPTSYLDSGIAFVHESFPEGYFVDIPTENWSVKTGNTWTYAAALINISPAQYTRSMSARGYLKINYATGVGYVYTAYSQDLHARSIYDVAMSAVNDKVTAENVISYVNNVADITVNITVNSGFEVSKANSVGNYNLSAVNVGSTVTVTFDKSVKTVVINGVRMLAGYTAEIVIEDQVYEVSGYKLSSNGLTATFSLESGDTTGYYKALAEAYRESDAYTSLHKQKILKILEEWNEDYSNAEFNMECIKELACIKTQTELHKNVGDTTLATPVVTKGLGYTVTWSPVEKADYYLVTDDNDYRNGTYVLATEALSYKTEVVGKHNVTVTAYSYYEEYKTSSASASLETVEVKPVFTYKAMLDGLYKFDKSQMNTMGIAISDAYYKDGDDYFVYYNKDTGWSPNEANATDWTSPTEFPAHAQRLKDMGNNLILIAYDTAASYSAEEQWSNSRMKYIMDTAWSKGMKVIVCDEVFYDLSMSDNSGTGATSKEQVTTAINNRDGFAEYVTHPAFYGFSLDDEPYGKYINAMSYTISALDEACEALGVSNPFYLACLFQAQGGEMGKELYLTQSSLESYYNKWLAIDGVKDQNYLYVDIYTQHAMDQPTNRYNESFEVIYSDNYLGGAYKFHQAITAHTQNDGVLLEQDLYMSLLYAAAHNVAGYSWFCYFPITGETSGSMVGFDGNGYGNGIGNSATSGYSYYNAAKTAGYQFELIQGLLDGYVWKTRSHNDTKNLLTTTLEKGGSTVTMYVNADVDGMKGSVNVTASGSVCYLVGYGVGTAEAPYEVVSGSITLQPGQAVICVG